MLPRFVEQRESSELVETLGIQRLPFFHTLAQKILRDCFFWGGDIYRTQLSK